MSKRLLAILDEHGRQLHALMARLALRHDVADDLLQELFLKLDGSPALKAAAHPEAYVWRAAINLAFGWRRANARHDNGQPSAQSDIDPQPPVWMQIDQREQVERILGLASELPELTRAAFVLRYIEQNEYEQVGQAIGRTAHQARGLCHAAVIELRKRLEVSDVGSIVSRNP